MDDAEQGLDRRLARSRARLLRRVGARRRARTAAVSLALLVVAGTGAATAISAAGAVPPTATCFDGPDLHAAATTVALRDGEDPAAVRLACARGRSEGAIVCRTASGGVAVFALRSTRERDRDCADLGLVQA